MSTHADDHWPIFFIFLVTTISAGGTPLLTPFGCICVNLSHLVTLQDTVSVIMDMWTLRQRSHSPGGKTFSALTFITMLDISQGLKPGTKHWINGPDHSLLWVVNTKWYHRTCFHFDMTKLGRTFVVVFLSKFPSFIKTINLHSMWFSFSFWEAKTWWWRFGHSWKLPCVLEENKLLYNKLSNYHTQPPQYNQCDQEEPPPSKHVAAATASCSDSTINRLWLRRLRRPCSTIKSLNLYTSTAKAYPHCVHKSAVYISKQVFVRLTDPDKSSVFSTTKDTNVHAWSLDWQEVSTTVPPVSLLLNITDKTDTLQINNPNLQDFWVL